MGNKTVYRKENINVGRSVVAAGTAGPSGQSSLALLLGMIVP